MRILTKSLRRSIESTLEITEDRIETSLESFPSVLINKGETSIQRPHCDWKADYTNRYSVIWAVTKTQLAVAVGRHPDELQRDYDNAIKELDYQVLNLEPGEVICFRGNLIHSGGKNPKGALRLHWYASYNPMVTGVPRNKIATVRDIYEEGQELEVIEKLE